MCHECTAVQCVSTVGERGSVRCSRVLVANALLRYQSMGSGELGLCGELREGAAWKGVSH